MTQVDENEKRQRNIKLAGEALKATRSKIVANMRFMDPAVFALKEQPANFGLRTDGTTLHYAPEEILKRSLMGLSVVTHDFMHVLLHCIFRHYAVKGKIQKKTWDLAVDIAVEELIASFGMECFDTPDKAMREDALFKLRRDRGRLTAEKIYRSLMDEPLRETEEKALKALFSVDDHVLWYEKRKPQLMRGEKADGEDASDADGNGDLIPDEDMDPQEQEGDQQDQDQQESQNSDEMSEGADLLSEQDWEKISQLVQTALETDERGQGNAGGQMLKELEHLHREKIDYTTFLRKFAARRESLKVDDNSFDYIFYTYGLELYGDMPLIEPLEYSDEKQIRDMVIAIDTSGSTDGPLVRSFIRKSFEILEDRSVIQSKFRIHVIQCDAEIQEDVLLRSHEDVDNYLENLEIKGLGGTDFRPVFTYVDELINRGELTDLRGLLYFTDGKGTFPKKMPSYDTAFIFVGDEGEDANVPPWAMKVSFDDAELKEQLTNSGLAYGRM